MAICCVSLTSTKCWLMSLSAGTSMEKWECGQDETRLCGHLCNCVSSYLPSLLPYLAVHKFRLTIPNSLRTGVGRLIS